jgi:N-acetylmuramoyl-L-alanine amidase
MMNRFALASLRLRLLTLAGALAVVCATQAHAQKRTIVIDAGHGGHDRGGVPGQRVSEKMMTLDVSQRVAQILRANGYRVVMTRNSDVFIPLPTRSAIANSNRGGMFVSVHFNSARRAGASGIETYYFRGDSVGLATNIHRNVLAVAPTENRGIRRRGYFVLRRTNIPGVLVECGFLTNPYEARYALNPAYRQRLAEAIARGVMGYRAPLTKALNPGSASSVDVLPQSLAGPDFVRAAPRRRVTRSRGGRRSKVSRRSSSRRKSSSSKRRKRTSQIEFIKVTADWRIC